MHSNSSGAGAQRTAALALACLLVAGCSHVQWPWRHQPPRPPVPVYEVDLGASGDDGYLQYWKRNTLLLDLSSAGASGQITLKPIEGSTWPVRLAFRVRPGAFAVLEVRGDERVSLPINPTGSAPIDLELAPGVYTQKTPQLTVSWGPAAVNTP
jgi:hypothetical protein